MAAVGASGMNVLGTQIAGGVKEKFPDDGMQAVRGVSGRPVIVDPGAAKPEQPSAGETRGQTAWIGWLARSPHDGTGSLSAKMRTAGFGRRV
jgi:hypothetical protein